MSKKYYTFLGKDNDLTLEEIVLLYIFSKSLPTNHILRCTGMKKIDQIIISDKEIKKEIYVPWYNFNLNEDKDYSIILDKKLDILNEINYNDESERKEIIDILLSNNNEEVSFVIELSKLTNEIKDIIKNKKIKTFSIKNNSFIQRIVKMMLSKDIDIEKECLSIIDNWILNPPNGIIKYIENFHNKEIFEKNIKNIIKGDVNE